MIDSLLRAYRRTILAHPRLTLATVLVTVAALAAGAPRFSIDASGDSLLLESDTELDYYREIRARYGSDEYLVLTYTPNGDLFARDTLQRLGELRDALAGVGQIASIVSILDVPLFESPPAEPGELADGNTRLLSPRTDLALAREELATSPLYANRLLSSDGRTTAMQLNIAEDPEYRALQGARDRLRSARAARRLDDDARRELSRLESQIAEHRDRDRRRMDATIADIRGLMVDYSDTAVLHLGGVPMINSDMLDFIRHDLVTFGLGLLVMLVLLLAAVFRKPRWVVIPLVTCAASVVSMVGLLGWLGWPVTVVSSNFVSLLLILTLSLTVHLAVRYRELRTADEWADQHELVTETVRTKFMPALLTALTTMVAFASLAFSDIRPVIDFGWMMVAGLAVAFACTFLVLPPALMLLEVGDKDSENSWTDRITGVFGAAVQRYPLTTLAVYAVVAAASAVGIARLSVDNRFIDYFSESTEIHQGMKVIDERLGGTTPLSIVLDAPQPERVDARAAGPGPDAGESERVDAGADAADDEFDFAELDDLPEFDELSDDSAAGITASSYWFNAQRRPTVQRADAIVDAEPAVGKVMSLAATHYVMRQLSGDAEPDNFALSVVYRKLPDDVKTALFDPYLSDDGQQTRIAARIFETKPDLDRDALLDSIRGQFSEELGIGPERVRLTGLFVLYNNVLHSLLTSQAKTAFLVLVLVFAMFAMSFRSARVAAIAVMPNVIGAMSVLGLMSLMNVPLDIMTITIAAIVIGIGVDDTIHYVHRFAEEFAAAQDYDEAIRRSHASVGRAIYYTSVTIVLGFAVLALSRFVPTIYFGVLTGLAMIVALVANLTLLPLLLARFRAYGEPGEH